MSRDEAEIQPEHRSLMLATISQQAAKKATYDALKRHNLPIPPDLNSEMEDVDE